MSKLTSSSKAIGGMAVMLLLLIESDVSFGMP